ncbi:MAG: starch-binding protein [Erysipelotrichaceae bacterium]|nr:starch-binding protein [Erysipelotrichaceae bacterium]
MKRKLILPLSMTGLLLSCATTAPTSSSQSTQQDSSAPQVSSQSSAMPSSSSSKTTSKSQGTSLPEIDYIKVFCESHWTNVWAWDAGGNLFDKWPGAELSVYDSDWKTFDFEGKTSLNLIFNEGSDANKTPDLTITSKGYWWYYQDQWYQENPIKPEESSEEEPTSEPAQTSYVPSGELDNRHRTWYQLLVYSFADSNGDGWGDFKGIANHLDYLQALGIGGLWLSPIHPAKNYHGYNVRNYKAVESRYEVNNYKFENLLADCHKRGIKVILDMVFNHTSDDHPWRTEHPDWYSNERIFGDSMPDLNYDNKNLRAAIKDVGNYWLNKGVDGFRCDAATWIYGGGGDYRVEQDKFQKSIAWWKEFSDAMKVKKSDVYLIGEVYTDLVYVEQFYASGMNAFNFSASYWPGNSWNANDSAKWVEEVAGHQKRIRQKDPNGVEASFLSNHDTGRFASQTNNKEQLVLANALNVLSPGGSYVYYGDELGMTGTSSGYKDMSYRTPMPFASGRTNSQAYMEGNSSSSNTFSGKNADQDKADKNSIFSKTAAAINYKNANPYLYSGAATQVETGDKKIGVLKVAGNGSNYYLLVNATGNAAQVTATGTHTLDFSLTGKDGGKVTESGGEVSMPAYSVAVLKGGEVTFRA